MQKEKWNAQAYAEHSKGQEVWARELIGKLALEGSEDILDLGCGDGKITALLAQATKGRVVGVDKSDEMIEFASHSYPNIEFMVADATQLSFENDFNVVFSNAVLHWVSDHRAVLMGLKKALRPKGKILLQFGGYGNAKEILEVMERFIASEYTDYFNDFTFPYTFPHSSEYKELLEECGFHEIRAELIGKDMVHESVKAFKGWIRTTWFPYTDVLPLEMRERFIDGFSDAYLERMPLDEKGRVHVNMVRLEVEAIS